MATLGRFLKGLFDFGLLALVFLLFLSAGSDSGGHFTLRFGLGLLLIVLFLLQIKKSHLPRHALTPLLLFAVFVGWEVLRWLVSLMPGPVPGMSEIYAASAVLWIFHLSLFAIPFFTFFQKNKVHALFMTLLAGGFFLAMNIMPPLLMHDGQMGYATPSGVRLFYPAFYFVPQIAQYFLAPLSHPNWVGDIISFGLFPALGLAVYGLFLAWDRSVRESESAQHPLVFALLYFTLALAMGAAILLLFSRGTILSLVISLGLFFIFLVMKFPGRQRIWMFVILLAAGLGFFSWAGNLKQAWREVQTVQREVGPETGASFGVNREGARRALAIFKENPIWGVGSGGYRMHARRHATPGIPVGYELANFESMNHPLQALAEEGIGAVFYLLFILAYFFETFRRLITTQSRFKFIMGLSLVMPVLLVFAHANINDLMQRFSTSLLVYFCMGASLAVLRSDFQHDEN